MDILPATQIGKGAVIRYESKLYKVIEIQQHTQARQSGYVFVKMRNLSDGTKREVKFSSSDKVQREFVEKTDLEYLYKDRNFYVFMDKQTYEQYLLEEDLIEDIKVYLIPNIVVKGLMVDNKIVGVEPPDYVELTVKNTEPYLKGATAQKSNKPAILETGLKVSVPFFIEKGDVVRIDTREDKYLERISKDN